MSSQDEVEEPATEYTPLGTFKTKKDARVHADTREHVKYRYHSNSSSTHKTTYVYRCAKHDECSSFIRIVVARGETECSMIIIESHSIVVADAPMTGIDKRIIDTVDAILLGTTGPKACRSTLQLRFADDPELLSLVPLESQLKSRKQTLMTQCSGTSLSSYADVQVWAASKKCFTKEEFFGEMVTYDPDTDSAEFVKQGHSYQNDLIVLSTFSFPVESDKPTLGVVVTSRRVFRNTILAIRGQPAGVVGVTDGTYKLHRGGWTVIDFGTSCTRFAQSEYVQSFMPFGYLFVRTENTPAYRAFFHIVKQGVREFFGMDLNLAHGSLDHCDSIKGAFLQVWPSILLTTCWPHVLRNSNKADKLKLLSQREIYKKRIRPSLDMLHACRTLMQFEAVSKLVLADWRDHNEHEYADWFAEEYLSSPWCHWFANGSGAPGVMPNQNHIEAHHRSIKVSAVISKRASTASVLNVLLPRILLQAGELANVKDDLRVFCGGPVASEVIKRAEILTAQENHMIQFTGRRVKVPVKVFFNSSDRMVHSKNPNGTQVSNDRVNIYVRSLQGKLQEGDGVSDVRLEYLGLHLVKLKTQDPVDRAFTECSWSLETVEAMRSKFDCDYKAFYSSGWLCAHVVACLSILQKIDISCMLDELEPRKVPGRPRKRKKALHKDAGSPNEYYVAKLVPKFLRHPGTPIKWNLCKKFVINRRSGVLENVPGQVKTYGLREQVYVWRCDFEHGKSAYLEVEELAECIEATWLSGYDVIPRV
jgi:hypothetical protein